MDKKLHLTFENPRPDRRYDELVVVNPGAVLLPTRYKKFADSIYNFKYRKDDILLSSYPKSGTTWTAGILWALTHIDELPRAYEEHMHHRMFALDNDFLHDLDVEKDIEMLRAKDPEAKLEDGITRQLAELEKDRRLIWSHLPFPMQNPQVFDKCKVVYVIREPKDNLFSRFNHFAKHYDLTVEKDLPPLAEVFMTGDTVYGSYWYHVQEAWRRRNHPNMHILFYEDMKADIMKELRKLNVFLELDLSEDQLQRVSEHTSFSNMKAHPTMGLLIREMKGTFLHKGEVGASKGKLPPELDARFDAWAKENALKVDPNFKYA